MRNFSPTDFSSTRYRLVLAFDLRDDLNKKAILSIGGPIEPDRTTLIFLPFQSKDVVLDEKIPTTVGQHSSYTLATYTIPEGRSGPFFITFSPIFSGLPQEPYSLDQLQGAIYFDDRRGLERLFVYRYGAYQDGIQKLRLETLSRDLARPDAIAVALPEKAIGREIRSGRTQVPDHDFDNGVARFYPPQSPSSDVSHIQVRYELPPSDDLNRYATIALKIVSALVTPILALIFIPSKDVSSPTLRRFAITALIIIQSCVVIGLLYLAFFLPAKPGLDIFGDLVVAAVAIIAGALPLYFKKGSS